MECRSPPREIPSAGPGNPDNAARGPRFSLSRDPDQTESAAEVFAKAQPMSPSARPIGGVL